MGLVASPLTGLFLLGLFVPRAGRMHAWLGVICSLVALIYAKYFTDLNRLLFRLVGIGVCVGMGCVASFIFSQHSNSEAN